MRISTSWMYQQSVSQMQAEQSAVNAARNSVSTGKAVSVASDNPVAATQIVSISHLMASQDNYVSGINSATTSLSLEQSTLSSISNLLNQANSIAIQSGNGALSSSDRSAMATQLSQVLTQLQQSANTTDTAGNYLFAGTAAGQPFVSNDDGSISYQGTDNTQMAAVGSGLQVATGDAGSKVFMNIPAGNGSFVASSDSANTGTLVVGSTSVTDTSAYNAAVSSDGGNYKISFDGKGTWTATSTSGSDAGKTVATGSYTAGDTSGNESISFNGMQIGITGTPTAGDSVEVTSGAKQDVFTTLQNMVTALNDSSLSSTQLTNTMNRQLESLQQATSQVTTTETSVGSRLSMLQTQSSNYSDLSVTYKTALSGFQDADMYQALSSLSLHTTALQASEQAFAKVSQLSLFDYIK